MVEEIKMESKRIILVTIDSLRFDRLKKMSNLYSFKDKALFYNNCYTAGEPTELSFPGILGSIYPSQIMSTVCFPKERRTIAEVLKEDYGFKTFAFIDSNPWCSSLLGYNRGFDYITDYLLKDIKKTSLPRIFKNLKNIFYPKFLRAILTPYLLNPKTYLREIMKKSIEVLKKDDGKLFLWIHFMDIHSPYRISLVPFNLRNVSCIKTYSKLSSIPNKVKIDQKDIWNISRMYDLAVRYFDSNFRLFLKYYFESEYSQGSSLIITADHGEELGERGNFYHMENVFPEVTHVPLMIFNKEIKPTNIDGFCSLRDISKTILGLAGIEDSYFFGKNILKNVSNYSISETLKPCMNVLMEGKSFSQALKIKLANYIYTYNSYDRTIFFDKFYFDKDFRKIRETEVPSVFKAHIENSYIKITKL